MKKFIFIIFALLAFGFVQAQNGKSLTFTPATNDSLVGAVTKYCTLSTPITGKWTGSIEIFLDQSVVGTDSCWVTIEGSQNNSTWYVLNNLGTPMLSGTAAVRSGQYRVSTTAGDAAIMWNFAYVLPPYVRIKVQHYVATASVKITRASIYLKR
jgi:hypothetical protein